MKKTVLKVIPKAKLDKKKAVVNKTRRSHTDSHTSNSISTIGSKNQNFKERVKSQTGSIPAKSKNVSNDHNPHTKQLTLKRPLTSKDRKRYPTAPYEKSTKNSCNSTTNNPYNINIPVASKKHDDQLEIKYKNLIEDHTKLQKKYQEENLQKEKQGKIERVVTEKKSDTTKMYDELKIMKKQVHELQNTNARFLEERVDIDNAKRDYDGKIDELKSENMEFIENMKKKLIKDEKYQKQIMNKDKQQINELNSNITEKNTEIIDLRRQMDDIKQNFLQEKKAEFLTRGVANFSADKLRTNRLLEDNITTLKQQLNHKHLEGREQFNQTKSLKEGNDLLVIENENLKIELAEIKNNQTQILILEQSYEMEKKILVDEFSNKFELQNKAIEDLHKENEILKKEFQDDVLLRISSNSNILKSNLKGLKQSSIESALSVNTSNVMHNVQFNPNLDFGKDIVSNNDQQIREEETEYENSEIIQSENDQKKLEEQRQREALIYEYLGNEFQNYIDKKKSCIQNNPTNNDVQSFSQHIQSLVESGFEKNIGNFNEDFDLERKNMKAIKSSDFKNEKRLNHIFMNSNLKSNMVPNNNQNFTLDTNPSDKIDLLQSEKYPKIFNTYKSEGNEELLGLDDRICKTGFESSKTRNNMFLTSQDAMKFSKAGNKNMQINQSANLYFNLNNIPTLTTPGSINNVNGGIGYPMGNAVKSYDLNDKDDLNKLMTIEEQKTIECLIGSSEERPVNLNFKKNKNHELLNDEEHKSQKLIEKNSNLIRNINNNFSPTPTLTDLESQNKHMFYTYDSKAAKNRISRSGPAFTKTPQSVLKTKTSPTNFIFNNQNNLNNLPQDPEVNNDEKSDDVLQYTDSRSDKYELAYNMVNYNKNSHRHASDDQNINMDQKSLQTNLGFTLKPDYNPNKANKEINILQRNSVNKKSQESVGIMRNKAKSDQLKKTRYHDLLAQHYKQAHTHFNHLQPGNVMQSGTTVTGSNRIAKNNKKNFKNNTSNNSQRDQLAQFTKNLNVQYSNFFSEGNNITNLNNNLINENDENYFVSEQSEPNNELRMNKIRQLKSMNLIQSSREDNLNFYKKSQGLSHKKNSEDIDFPPEVLRTLNRKLHKDTVNISSALSKNSNLLHHANFISDLNYQEPMSNMHSINIVKPPTPPKKKSNSQGKSLKQEKMFGNQGTILINNDAESFSKPIIQSQRNPKSTRSNNNPMGNKYKDDSIPSKSSMKDPESNRVKFQNQTFSTGYPIKRNNQKSLNVSEKDSDEKSQKTYTRGSTTNQNSKNPNIFEKSNIEPKDWGKKYTNILEEISKMKSEIDYISGENEQQVKLLN